MLRDCGNSCISFRAFCTFVRFALVWFCLFPLPLGVWEGLRFVIVALPGLFSYFFSTDIFSILKIIVWAQLLKLTMSLVNVSLKL